MIIKKQGPNTMNRTNQNMRTFFGVLPTADAGARGGAEALVYQAVNNQNDFAKPELVGVWLSSQHQAAATHAPTSKKCLRPHLFASLHPTP
jgi:hypothetical protein